jgi:hypothetical protein
MKITSDTVVSNDMSVEFVSKNSDMLGLGLGIANFGLFNPCPFCGAAAKRFSGMFARFDNGREKLCGTHDGINHWMRSAQCLSKTGRS